MKLVPKEISCRTVKADDATLFRTGMVEYYRSQYYLSPYRESCLLKLTRDVADRLGVYWNSLNLEQRMLIELGIIVPASLISLYHGFLVPDLDIPLLGIGWHRHFLFHSALAAYASRKFYEYYITFVAEKANTTAKKVLGAVLAAGAVGIGVHLLADGSFGLLDGEKSVVFGLPGITKINTAVTGTFVDDNLWLLGNSLWAFKIATDLIVMAFGQTEKDVRTYVKSQFSQKSVLEQTEYDMLPGDTH